jgi:hypothetical protein
MPATAFSPARIEHGHDPFARDFAGELADGQVNDGRAGNQLGLFAGMNSMSWFIDTDGTD